MYVCSVKFDMYGVLQNLWSVGFKYCDNVLLSVNCGMMW